MHIIGQHKHLSLALEEGDPSKYRGDRSDFGGAESRSDLFQHKLSPGCYYGYRQTVSVKCPVHTIAYQSRILPVSLCILPVTIARVAK